MKDNYPKSALPEGWVLAPVGAYCDVIDPQPDHRAPALDPDGLPYIGIRDVNYDGTVNEKTARMVAEKAVIKQEKAFRIESNNLVFCKVGTLGQPRHLNLEGKRVALSATLVLIKPKSNCCERYLKHVLESDYLSSQIYSVVTGATRPALGIQQIRKFKLPFPPLNTQKDVGRFLDQKVSQIDEAISCKKKQIELLKERKQIIIQQAVTQGLNPDAPMKDSDVDWIGTIPEHWEVRRSKFLFTQRKEKAWKDDVQLSATQKFGVIPQDEYEARTGARVVKIQFHLDKRKHVEKDDFVISMRSFQGGLERAWSRGCIRSSYVILRPLEPIDPNFYGYLLKLPMYIKALQRTASFIRDGQDLNFDNFSQVDLFIPPLDEQKAIADYVRGFMESSDDGISLMEEQIVKLKEYKTTLINSAVTGKIKVTELA
ncbi:restriction endonuclease subunit S [Vibrio pelagius]|uniref:restriction endonuclease subunit S n=1 Tax=Vibrio pelagius TaxID=28169 RepID=UPI0021C416C4|nr:restriction endonuclease subunit S [Vibrio pelagius]